MDGPPVEDDFRLGLLLDEEHSRLLIETAALSGRAPLDLIDEAIEQWYRIWRRVEQEEDD